MKTWKLVSGILSIILSVFVLLQSAVAGLGNSLLANGEVSGSAGLIVAMMLLSGGIVSIATRNRATSGGDIALIVLFGIGGFLGVTLAGSYSDLYYWGCWCFICAITAIVSCRKKKREQIGGQTRQRFADRNGGRPDLERRDSNQPNFAGSSDSPVNLKKGVQRTSGEMMEICPYCGNPVQTGWKKCPNCGEKIGNLMQSKMEIGNLNPTHRTMERQPEHKKREMGKDILLIVGGIVILALIKTAGHTISKNLNEKWSENETTEQGQMGTKLVSSPQEMDTVPEMDAAQAFDEDGIEAQSQGEEKGSMEETGEDEAGAKEATGKENEAKEMPLIAEVPVDERAAVFGGGWEQTFILPYSDCEYAAAEDLENLDSDALRIARNEIYARHGRRFKDSGLQSYFENFDWYKGTITPDDFDESCLNEVERSNIETIAAWEN